MQVHQSRIEFFKRSLVHSEKYTYTCIKAISAIGVRLMHMWKSGILSTNSTSLSPKEDVFAKSTPFTVQCGYFKACKIILQ